MVTGAGAGEVAGRVRSLGASGVEVQGSDDSYRLRADDVAVLCDALSAVGRPAERVRVDVDPLR